MKIFRRSLCPQLLSSASPAAKKAALLAGVLLLSSVATAEFASARLAKTAQYEIDYTSAFAGIVKIRYCTNAIYMRLEKMGLVIMARSPKWEAEVFNEMNKKCMVMPKEFWKKRFAGAHHSETVKEKVETVDTHKSEKIQGFPAEKYEVLRSTKGGPLEKSMEVWVTSVLDVPDDAKEFFRAILRVPANFQGTPLRVVHRQPATGAMVSDLEAFKIVKSKVNASDFKPIVGFKTVKNEVSLMLDDEGEGGGMGMMNMPEQSMDKMGTLDKAPGKMTVPAKVPAK